MASIIEIVAQSFKKSLNFEAWLYFLAANVLAIVLMALSFVPSMLVLLAAFWPLVAKLLSSPPQQWLFVLWGALASNLLFFVLAIAIAAVIAAVLLLLAEAFCESLFYNFANSFLASSKISFSESFRKARQRFFVLFKASVLLGIFYLILFVVLMLPTILFGLSLLPGLSGKGLAGIGVALAGLAMAFAANVFVAVIVLILLLPLFLLLVPIALFEKLGALASLKRSVSIGKRNYLRLLGFWFLLLVLLLVLSLIVSFVQVGLNIIPIAGAALGFVISVVFNVWASLFSVLAVVMLYNELASPLAFEKPSLAPSFSKAKQAKRKPRKKKR